MLEPNTIYNIKYLVLNERFQYIFIVCILYPEEEKHTKLPEEIINIKIKNSIEENDILKYIRNRTIEEAVVNFDSSVFYCVWIPR